MAETIPAEPKQLPKRLFERLVAINVTAAKPNGYPVPNVVYRFPEFNDKDDKDCDRKLIHFCFPDLQSLIPTSDFKSQKFSFVLTRDTGEKRFAYVLRSFRHGVLTEERYPICYCILAYFPCYQLFMQILKQCEKYSTENPRLSEFLQAVFDSPPPPPGEKTLPIEAPSPTGEPNRYCFSRPPDSDYLIETIELDPLFCAGSARNIATLFSHLLHERRMIFMSADLSRLSSAVQAAVALLYPFSWQYIYIPILPQTALMICCAPMPFVVGVLRQYLPNILEMKANKMIEAEVVLYDLDEDSFIIDPHTSDFNALPTKQATALLSGIESIKKLCDQNRFRADSWNSSQLSTVVAKLDEEKRTHNKEIGAVFLNFFASLLGGIRRHFRTEGAGPGCAGTVRFDRNGWLSAESSANPEVGDWLRTVFVGTQLFDNFISEREEFTFERFRGPFEKAIATIDKGGDVQPQPRGFVKRASLRPASLPLTERPKGFFSRLIVGSRAQRNSLKLNSSSYDLVVGIENLADVVTTGWPVDAVSFVDHLSWDGHIVGIMGMFNKGKTFILNRLCGIQLRSGDTEKDKTVGLSIKFLTTEDTRKHIVLDSAGLHRPLTLKEANMDTKISDALFNMEVTQEFLNSLIIRLADYIILVVDHMTIFDQKFLQQLIRQRSQQRREFKQVFVCHNIRSLHSVEEYDSLWRSLCNLYDGVEVLQTIRLHGDLKDYEVKYFQAPRARHVMIGNDHGQLGKLHNKLVFELLRCWIQHIVPRRPVVKPSNNAVAKDVSGSLQPLLQPLIHGMNDLLPGYFEGFKEVVFDPRVMIISHVDRLATFKLEKLRALGIAGSGTGLIAGSEWLMQFTPSKRVFVTENFFVIELEIPGIDPHTIRITPAKSELPDHFGVTIEGVKPLQCSFDVQVEDPTTCMANTIQHGRFALHIDIPNTYDLTKPRIEERLSVLRAAWPKLVW